MKTKKQLIHLTESDLHRVIKESVNKIINEVKDIHQPSTEDNQFDIMPSGMYRGSYDSFRKNAREDWRYVISTLQQILSMFDRNSNASHSLGELGYTAAQTAKTYGGVKSYKRVLNAQKYLQKAVDLLLAAEQDVFATYVDRANGKEYSNSGDSYAGEPLGQHDYTGYAGWGG